MAGSKGMPIYSASYFTVCIILTRCPETPLIFSQAAEVLSQNETCVSFWGEKLDEQVEGLTTTKKYTVIDAFLGRKYFRRKRHNAREGEAAKRG
jgi:hypothetical protein